MGEGGKERVESFKNRTLEAMPKLVKKLYRNYTETELLNWATIIIHAIPMLV